MIWWLAFEKKPFQFWRKIWIQVVVILLQLYLKPKMTLRSFWINFIESTLSSLVCCWDLDGCHLPFGTHVSFHSKQAPAEFCWSLSKLTPTGLLWETPTGLSFWIKTCSSLQWKKNTCQDFSYINWIWWLVSITPTELIRGLCRMEMDDIHQVISYLHT